MGASMSARLRIAMAQINPVVGDISGNAELIKSSVVQASDAGADVIVFPEMVLTGYPVEDLALRPAFRRASIDAIQILAREIKELGQEIYLLWWDITMTKKNPIMRWR